jgi:hypothetical protein
MSQEKFWELLLVVYEKQKMNGNTLWNAGGASRTGSCTEVE